MTTTWELLNDAADIIERGGHTKGTVRDTHGHCIAGALHAAEHAEHAPTTPTTPLPALV